MNLLNELSAFLRMSATNVEWMSDPLRTELNISTGLDTVVRAAIEAKKTVVIAGTAGSGKTHLLHTLGAISGYRVIPDLTALAEADWPGIFDSSQPALVAGNEGAFLQGSYKSYRGFAEVVDLLHAIQKGGDPHDDGPVVIDAAGFDPAGSRAIARIAQLPILKSYAEARTDLSATSWQMFSDDRIRQRLAILVEAASAEAGTDGFTFRQLWQFVGDMLHGKTDDDQVWFERVFAGDCEVSRRVASTFSPVSVALPHIGNQLWHGDLVRLKSSFLEAAIPTVERLLTKMLPLQQLEPRQKLFRTLRVCAAFGLRESPLDGMLDGGLDLWSKVRARDPIALLQAINRYFAFGLIELGDDLELWLQHDTERRLFKPDVQISLGSARAADFSIRRSNVIANRPEQVEQIEGGRLLLVHDPSGATLSVTKDLIDGILHTRSHRTNERRDVEYDWRIGRFFEQVAGNAAKAERLKAARFDFQARSGRLIAWQISPDRVRRVVA